MPKQNRVTPIGEIIATPARGMLLGNRGCLHNARQQIVRPYQLKRWIICRLAFKDRHRTVMTPGQYTELFFLDEVTALAAGHRPCAECSRDKFESFRLHWARANSELAHGTKPLATAIDEILHRERCGPLRQKVTYAEKLGALPEGSFVRLENGQAYLVIQQALLEWHPEGYSSSMERAPDRIVQVLTPRSIVRALAAGYRAMLHPSVPKRITDHLP
ncbi:hypothetical protein HUU05_30050 [candidate division KSB1 bacterium]|nr:hypothetical protein [candidate division KSB1 bacterium]